MKKKFLFLMMALLLVFNVTVLSGCDLFGLFYDDDDGQLPQIDNSIDLDQFTPEPDDDNVYVENQTYYTSKSIDLVTEINGNYTVDRPFTLDPDNENKRIYHNIYLYEEDFLQVLYYEDVGDLGRLFVIMSDVSDQEYAEIEYGLNGSPLQINVIEQGIFDIILDVETFAIDLVKIGDIDTPVYETIKTCELNIHLSQGDHTYTPMTLNQDNEFFVQAEIPMGASIGFYSASHMSHYKLTVEFGLIDTLVYYNIGLTKPSQVQVHVGGRYNVYFNAKTYVLRLELQNPETAEYFCQVEWNQGNVLTAKSSATPYLFEYEFVAQGRPNDPYVDIPSFFPQLGMAYKLTIIDLDGVVAYDQYITEEGTYKLTINLKEFTLSIERIS